MVREGTQVARDERMQANVVEIHSAHCDAYKFGNSSCPTAIVSNALTGSQPTGIHSQCSSVFYHACQVFSNTHGSLSEIVARKLCDKHRKGRLADNKLGSRKLSPRLAMSKCGTVEVHALADLQCNMVSS